MLVAFADMALSACPRCWCWSCNSILVYFWGLKKGMPCERWWPRHCEIDSGGIGTSAKHNKARTTSPALPRFHAWLGYFWAADIDLVPYLRKGFYRDGAPYIKGSALTVDLPATPYKEG